MKQDGERSAGVLSPSLTGTSGPIAEDSATVTFFCQPLAEQRTYFGTLSCHEVPRAGKWSVDLRKLRPLARCAADFAIRQGVRAPRRFPSGPPSPALVSRLQVPDEHLRTAPVVSVTLARALAASPGAFPGRLHGLFRECHALVISPGRNTWQSAFSKWVLSVLRAPKNRLPQLPVRICATV